MFYIVKEMRSEPRSDRSRFRSGLRGCTQFCPRSSGCEW
jgi:hypothetical protein